MKMTGQRNGLRLAVGMAFVAGLFARPLLSAPAQAQRGTGTAEDGRYQMAFGPQSSTPTVIDTKTGEVWYHLMQTDPHTHKITGTWRSMGTPAAAKKP
jgi:hypothetical protein